MSLCPSYK